MGDTKLTDQRAIKTHHAIEATFKDMIRTMDADKISISDIAAQAGINRKTFYLHYECREDLFNEVCDEIVHRYATAMAKVDTENFTMLFYSTFFEFFAKQDLYVERILCDPSYCVYRDRIVAACATVNRSIRNIYVNMDEEERLLFKDYAAVNMFALYRRWVELDKSIPVDHLIKFSKKIVYQGMSSIEG